MSNDLPGAFKVVLDCPGTEADPLLVMRFESPTTGEEADKVEVEGAADATVMAWLPHNIRSMFLSSCCVRSSVARLSERSSMHTLRPEISASTRTPIAWMRASIAVIISSRIEVI